MADATEPLIAIDIAHAPVRTRASNYPEPFASMMAGRVKRPIGDLFGVTGFGVNHVTLPPGAVSSLHHRHDVQDEFVLVLTGELVLVHDAGETVLHPGMGAGFPARGTAHHLVNRSGADATYVEVGDRRAGDAGAYPRDDLVAVRNADNSGWLFTRKDGTAFD